MDKKSRAPYSMDRLTSLVNRAKEKGLIIKLMGPALEFAPSLIIKKEEIDWAVKILDQVITEEEKAMGL
jgi:adenosylmethionine-8-amino-7-oxononanoate aminotransferase